MSGPYDDIIDLPHPVSATHPQMPRENRAAQFSPFAALTGYEGAIHETARLTDARKEFDESALAAVDMKLQILADAVATHPEVAVTHYIQDEKKEGGAYITSTGALKKVDAYERAIVLMDGRSIAMEDVLEIECALFGMLMRPDDTT